MSIFSELKSNGQTPLQSLRYGSAYLSLPNPDPVLRAIYKRDAYNELLTDGRVVSLIEQRISAVVGKEISIICDNKQIKEKIEYWLNVLPYSQIIDDAWQGVYYGFMPMELLWNYDKKADLLLPNAIRRRNLYDFHYNKNNELIYKILGVCFINCVNRYQVVKS